MKTKFLVLAIAAIASLIAVGANFASAPSYNYLLLIVLISDLIAIACMVFLIRAPGRWRWVVLPIAVLVLYTLADSMGRFFLHTRVLDVLG